MRRVFSSFLVIEFAGCEGDVVGACAIFVQLWIFVWDLSVKFFWSSRDSTCDLWVREAISTLFRFDGCAFVGEGLAECSGQVSLFYPLPSEGNELYVPSSFLKSLISLNQPDCAKNFQRLSVVGGRIALLRQVVWERDLSAMGLGLNSLGRILCDALLVKVNNMAAFT